MANIFAMNICFCLKNHYQTNIDIYRGIEYQVAYG